MTSLASAPQVVPTPEESLSLGVLDFGAVGGADPSQVLRDLLTLAELADELGFTRFWLGEHHNGTAWAAPDLLLPLVASRTGRIRVGTAGILLNFRHPLEVANGFALLDCLFPGRIDLGLARGKPGVNQNALQHGRTDQPSPEAYERKVDELVMHLTSAPEVGHPAFGSKVFPERPTSLELWLLGSNRTSAELAARVGANLGLSAFHTGAAELPALRDYQEQFRPTTFLPQPRSVIAVGGVCAESASDAARVPRLPAAAAVPLCVGTPHDWVEGLRRLREESGVSEFVYLDLSLRTEDKARAYVLLAEALAAERSDVRPTPAAAGVGPTRPDHARAGCLGRSVVAVERPGALA